MLTLLEAKIEFYYFFQLDWKVYYIKQLSF